MLKILPRRSPIAGGTPDTADTAPGASRSLARFIDGRAGGMPAPRRPSAPDGEPDSDLMPASPRPA